MLTDKGAFVEAVDGEPAIPLTELEEARWHRMEAWRQEGDRDIMPIDEYMYHGRRRRSMPLLHPSDRHDARNQN